MAKTPTSEIKEMFMLVKTKTGKYLHPIHYSHAVDFDSSANDAVKSLACMTYPTHVSVPTDEEFNNMPRCIFCAMAIIYGDQTRKDPEPMTIPSPRRKR